MGKSLTAETMADLRATLADPTWSAYVCVAGEHDRVWELATSLEGTFARLDVYRADSHDVDPLVASWFPPQQAGTERHVAAVFGFSDRVVATLTRQQAESRATVRDAIRTARLQ